MCIEISGFTKGYAVDKVASLPRQCGIANVTDDTKTTTRTVALAGPAVRGKLAHGGGAKAPRSIKEIALVLVFERNKSTTCSIHNRALRDEQGLQGRVVLELINASADSVTQCRTVSNGLKTPELDAKPLRSVRQLHFSAKDVDQMVVTWSADFL